MNRSRAVTLVGLLLVAFGVAVAALIVFGGDSSPTSSDPLPPSARQPVPGGPSDGPSATGGREPSTSSEERRTDPAAKMDVDVDFSKFRQLLPRDAIFPIYEPRFRPGQVTSLPPGDLVIGLEIKGEAKAYPIGPLNRREMVNDVVGGVPVLVTW